MLDGKYNKENEKEIQEYWSKNKIYEFKYDENKETYSVDTPPPTVSGSLHMGHIFSYTQAEILVRYKRIRGFNVYYPFGFDDNGLPTERLVEKETGKKAKDYTRSEFAKICHETALKYEEEFQDLWSNLGFSVDWNLKYETNNPLSQRISQRSFIELAKKGKAYQKEEPVLWCINCQTSIAQAELDSKESETTFNYIPFYVDGEIVEVATTRPEFLGGCRALLINPLDKRADKLAGKLAKVPLYEHLVPVILDEGAELEKGSGAVMCCTYGDTVDVEWAKKHNLDYIKVIESNGVISDDIKFIGGLYVTKARKQIIELLEENGLLLKQETITHNVNTHERCGTNVEIIPSKQWYVDVLTDKERYLKAADELNWYPTFMKNRYISWVENLKWDWCISRQRYYGVPFPVWYCKDCEKAHYAADEELPVNPLEKDYVGTCECGSSSFIPEKDVMDTWATSSVTPLINARWKEKDQKDFLIPMTMRTQAHEIIRTWAFYTIVKSLYHTGELPWKDLMISGFVLAKKGEKLSKSKNNSASEPNTLIEKYGADAIRYWTAANKLGTDTSFSEDDIKSSNRFLTKLWNASKFILMQLEDYDLSEPEHILDVDKWLMNRFNQTQANFIKAMDKYEVGLARKEIDAFFWNDLCDNYLEIAKERLYQPKKHGEDASKSGKYTLYNILLGVLKIYSIFVPHEAEQIFLSYYKDKIDTLSVSLLELENKEFDKDIIEHGEKLKELVSYTRKYKTEKGLSMKAEIEELTLSVDEKDFDFFNNTRGDIAACLGIIKFVIIKGETFNIFIEGDKNGN